MTPDEALAEYIATSLPRPLPASVAERARMHLLDTLVAIITGRRLPAGRLGMTFARQLGGAEEATLLGSGRRVGIVQAAFANALAAHADETDDSHTPGRFHPGCGIVPVALAFAEREARTASELLQAIVLGYDVGARAVLALGYDSPRTARFSTHSLGTLFGAVAAGGALLGLDPRQTEITLSYAAQQASGLPYWNRDPDHIEKSFVFGANSARNAVHAALLAQAGFTSPRQPLTGERGFLDAFAERPDPSALTDELGVRFEIERASLKKWCVGSPIQSVLDGLEVLLAGEGFDVQRIASVHVEMPADRFHITDNRDMPAVCLQHLVALMLVRGTLTYATIHDETLMRDPAVLSLRARITTAPSQALAQARPERQSIVRIVLDDGSEHRHHGRNVRGTPDNPMTPPEVATKARQLLTDQEPATVEALIGLCLDEADFDIARLVSLCRVAEDEDDC